MDLSPRLPLTDTVLYIFFSFIVVCGERADQVPVILIDISYFDMSGNVSSVIHSFSVD